MNLFFGYCSTAAFQIKIHEDPLRLYSLKLAAFNVAPLHSSRLTDGLEIGLKPSIE